MAPSARVRSKNPTYGGKSSTPDAAAIARLAARQHGMVTRAQLLRLGLSAKAIDYRVRTGRLWRAYNGVYCVGRPPVTPHERAMAAVLACGPRAALSHRPGGALWEIGLRWPAMMEVTAPGQRQRKGIRVHRSPLTRRDITRHYGIPVTTLVRVFPSCGSRGTG
jgi:hypothetical protein